MPSITLKPGSPEYAEEEESGEAPHRCEMPGCTEAATHRAPKDASLNGHWRFCADHAKAHNEAWNYFAALAPGAAAAQMRESLYGDRPTWRYGAGAEDALRRAADALRWAKDAQEPPRPRKPLPPDTPEGAAMALMDLTPPLTLEALKARYRDLAKRWHPDRNAGCKEAEEHLKRINMAYTLLKAAWGQWEDLSSSS
ncbi:MAG TPA: molecular chaperone DnaJ [Rhodospirillaceae bacterium]|nr:J domain-containing protein [Alphaproteobacteria bacterium]HBH27172.1 molecular chaperone DnaJ [Rhodospirillaceae bacterium]